MRPPIIDDVSQITAAWLQEVLADDGVEATVASVVASPVGTGQMASCYRVHVTYAAGDGPARVVVKLPAAEVADRAGSAMGYRCETGFYRDVAPRIDVRLPRVHLALASEDGTTFTLVLEDLAPAEQGDQIAGCTVEEAVLAATNVTGLHAATWCDPALHDLDWTIPFPLDDQPGAEFLAAVVVDATTSLLARVDVDAATEAVLHRFGATFETWMLGRSSPFSLIHGDHRLDNLLFSPAGAASPEVIAVDWQTVSVGRPLSDVTFLVAAGLDPADRRPHEREIVGRYHQALVAHGVEGYDEQRCWDDYRYALLHPLMITVLGALVSKPSDRGDRMFGVMADRIASAVADHDPFALIGSGAP